MPLVPSPIQSFLLERKAPGIVAAAQGGPIILNAGQAAEIDFQITRTPDPVIIASIKAPGRNERRAIPWIHIIGPQHTVSVWIELAPYRRECRVALIPVVQLVIVSPIANVFTLWRYNRS